MNRYIFINPFNGYKPGQTAEIPPDFDAQRRFAIWGPTINSDDRQGIVEGIPNSYLEPEELLLVHYEAFNEFTAPIYGWMLMPAYLWQALRRTAEDWEDWNPEETFTPTCPQDHLTYQKPQALFHEYKTQALSFEAAVTFYTHLFKPNINGVILSYGNNPLLSWMPYLEGVPAPFQKWVNAYFHWSRCFVRDIGVLQK